MNSKQPPLPPLLKLRGQSGEVMLTGLLLLADRSLSLGLTVAHQPPDYLTISLTLAEASLQAPFMP